MSENRQNIIDATQRLLQTHGLARLTTRAIAREAKVAEGLIYHHFKDKAELIYETSQTMMSETKNILQIFLSRWEPVHCRTFWKTLYIPFIVLTMKAF